MGTKTTDQEIPAFSKTTLNNGVRVLTETIPSVRSISVGAWIYTGSRDEREEESGISHFIEHMVFKGTKKRRMHHIAQRLESVGGYLNAFTTKEYTCYYARALDEHLERSIDLVCDLVLHPEFPPKELEKEKDVVLEEMKMYEDTPDEYVFDCFEEVLFKDHPLGRPIIGFPETVTAFTRDQLQSYVDQHYTPDRIILAVAGNAAHEDVVRIAEKVFASSERRAQGRQHVPVNGYGPEQLVVRKPIQQAHLVLGTRGFSIRNPKRTALTVLNTLLGGGMSSRLNQNIRERYGFCYSIYSFVNMHSDTGDFGVYMGTDAGRIERSKKLIFRELERLANEPVSDRTLTLAKNQVKGSLMLGLENMSNRMMRIGRQELYFERCFTLDEIVQDVNSVTIEDVRTIAQELFNPDRFSAAVLLPEA
ncbi:MAG TPA: pitrilysin family protein [Rhodothermales bacterium]|nr:pitrilysin family protein [Rhodothermales bacterium]